MARLAQHDAAPTDLDSQMPPHCLALTLSCSWNASTLPASGPSPLHEASVYPSGFWKCPPLREATLIALFPIPPPPSLSVTSF